MAEGCGRGTDSDFKRFLQISMGSACEVEYLLLIRRDLHYLDDSLYRSLTDRTIEIKRMLAALIADR
jgi:four helix bundle protein